ncbi:hypothetical protein HDE_13106 [Halotydeus destructor]|nr:hypothetical protein HDE_13106 [Halotydeus destructor]
MLYHATLPLSLLILSLLPVIILSKDCDGSYGGPAAVANVINNNQDGFVVFSDGVKFKTAGPLRNGAPPTSSSDSQLGQVSLVWVYANGSQLVSRQGNNLARQEVDDGNWVVGEEITKSSIYEAAICITAYEDKLLVQYNDKQVLVRQNKIEFTAKFPDRSLHPTGLTRTKDNDIIAFFGPLVGLYEHSTQSIFPIYLELTKKYWLSQAWLGCKPDLCFDASIDAASNDGQYLELYKGKYLVMVNMSTKAFGVISPANSYFVDAAIQGEGDFYMFIDKKAYTRESNGSVSEAEFLSEHGNIEAGFSINDTLYLIHQGEVTIYDLSFESRPIELLWPELPETTIDGATALEGFIYFFIGDFYYRTSSSLNETNPVDGPFFTMDLLNCNDRYYKNSAAVQALGILDKHTFRKYISQFRPDMTRSTRKPSTAPDVTGSTRPPELSTANQPSSTQSSKKSVRDYFFLVAMALLLLIVLIALVAMMVHIQRTNRGISFDTLNTKTTVVTIDSVAG